MPAPRVWLLFCLQVLVIHVVLFCLWPLVHPGYARLFRFGARAVAGSVAAASGVTTQVLPGPDRVDTEIRVGRRDSNRVGVLRVDSRFTGYLPVSLILALGLATPAVWRVRLLLMLAGLVAITFFTGLRIGMSVLLVAQEIGAITMPSWPLHILSRLEAVLGHAASSVYLVPLCIWIALLIGFGRGRISRPRHAE